MLDKHKRRELFIIISLFLTFLIFVLMFVSLGVFVDIRATDLKTSKKTADLTFIRDDVLLKCSDGKEMRVNLPKKFDSDYTYSYNFVPKLVAPNKKLFMYVKSSYNVFTLSHKDEVIYQREVFDTKFLKSGGDYIRIVLIPDKYIGKELTIKFSSLKKSQYGILVPFVILGTHSELIYYNYLKDIDVLIISAFLLVFSIESFIMLVALKFYRKLHNSSFLGPLYALVLGFYIIVRSPTLHFAIPRGSFIYVLDYLLFLILPLSIAMFMVSVARHRGGKKTINKIIELVISLFILNLIVQSGLTLFGYSEFMDMQKISQFAAVSVALISVIVPFTVEEFEFKKILSTSIALLMIVLVVLLGVYLSTYRIRYLTILGIVGGLFILFQSLVLMKMYANTYAISYKAKLHKGLAFTDNLTHLSNRNAFENEIKDIDERGQKMLLMIIDINNLKEINDKFGHNAGDFTIKSAADLLMKMNNHFDKLTPYRIGGDEFVVIGLDVDSVYAEKAVSYLNKEVEQFRKKRQEIPFNFAVGYAITELDQSFNIDKFMEEVDKKMYEDKKMKKRNFYRAGEVQLFNSIT